MLWWKIFYRSPPFPGFSVQPKKHTQVLLRVIFSKECSWVSDQIKFIHARVVVFRVDVPPGHRVLPLALCFVVNFGVAIDDCTEVEFVLWFSGGFQFVGRVLFRQHGVGTWCVACFASATHCCGKVDCVVRRSCWGDWGGTARGAGRRWYHYITDVAVFDLFNQTSMYKTKCFCVQSFYVHGDGPKDPMQRDLR